MALVAAGHRADHDVRATSLTPPRRAYIDWLRGVGVLVMVLAHVFDAWTAVGERTRPVYGYLMVLAGLAAPVFLFLAGVSLALAIGGRISKGTAPAAAAAAAQRRGWRILGLAFLFRLQAWVLSGGAPLQTVLKVDILNVMGLAMAGTALVWAAGRDRRWRIALLSATTVVMAMATPLVRATPYLTGLPDPIESYVRPIPGLTTFALFPWAAFVVAGTAAGLCLDAVPAGPAERRANVWLGVVGFVVAGSAYAMSLLPPIYAVTSFWTSSPTFFFVRLGLLMVFVALAYGWERRWWGGLTAQRSPLGQAAQRSPLVELGQASLFVYWIHVEMAYGALSLPFHKRFSLEEMVVVYVLFLVFLFGLTRIKRALSKSLTDRRLAA